MTSLRKHQSRSAAPAPQLIAMLRCPITKELIPPGDGCYIGGRNLETGAAKDFYVHTAALYPDGKEAKAYLASVGYEMMHHPLLAGERCQGGDEDEEEVSE